MNPASAMGTSPVRRSVVVETSATHAFEVFAEQLGSWWPLLTHHIGRAPAKSVVIEPCVGGRWFERGQDGSECDWGRVLVWDPPRQLVLAWQIAPTWEFDPNLLTEVDVRFVAEAPRRTRVDLEHRKLENFAAEAENMRTLLERPNAWQGILKVYAECLSRVEDEK